MSDADLPLTCPECGAPAEFIAERWLDRSPGYRHTALDAERLSVLDNMLEEGQTVRWERGLFFIGDVTHGCSSLREAIDWARGDIHDG